MRELVVKYKAEKVCHEEMVKMPLVDLKVLEVYTKSKKEHELHLKMNLDLLKKEKCHVKPNKSLCEKFGGSWDTHFPKAEIGESKMIALELEQETTKVVVIKEMLKEAKDRVIHFGKKDELAPSCYDVIRTLVWVSKVISSKIPIVKVSWNSKRNFELTWTDGHSERTFRTLENMFKACVRNLVVVGILTFREAEIGESKMIGHELEQETTKKFLADTNLHVHLEEIKVDKTLCFVEEPVEIIDREVKSLKRSRISIVKSIGTRSKAAVCTLVWAREVVSSGFSIMKVR
nr:hypothetical protein [Tanacetum cinerariifolium]